ncbi:MAG: thioredoxin family protein [Thermoanaerobaculales bacterium]|nr:thioredoxin family protein [Thermoanaerobaculales bacterium]
MKFVRTDIPLLITIVLMLVALSSCGAEPAPESSAEAGFAAVSTHETAALAWEKSWESAFARASSEGKPVLVSFEAEWCVWCKKLDSTTYRDSAVMALISDRLVPLTLDVDGAGEALSGTHNVESLPTVLVFSPNGEEQGRINGFLPPGQFVDAVTDILQES